MIGDSETIHRHRGGQPGNHNHLKHGRYVVKNKILAMPTTGEDHLQLIDQLVYAIKKSMDKTFKAGLKSTDTQEILKTMNSLTMAAIGLCRLLRMHDRLDKRNFLSKFDTKEESSLELLKKTISAFNFGSSSQFIREGLDSNHSNPHK
jgi:hypothetical protein